MRKNQKEKSFFFNCGDLFGKIKQTNKKET